MSTFQIPCPDSGRPIVLDLEPRLDSEGDAAMGAVFCRSLSGHEVTGARYADTGELLDEIPDEVREAGESQPVELCDPANDL
ncbi:MAG: hypothetical protein AAGA55_03130 [Planctomycetota bacterium]